ncbi:MAG: TetR/AcrR family transcriptional regulator [Lachnospiraceae bacterium]|nr:TetR/AcrR family transcriptional regulator [Lachnospiraceae bacterium]
MKKQLEITDRTRRRFVDAFWALAQEKPIRKITVNELTRRAGYNRSTFYEYFTDTDDLLSYAEKELLEETRQTILRILPEDSASGNLFQTNLFSIIFAAMNEKMYILMGPNGDPGFLPTIKTELVPLVLPHIPISTDTPNFDYLIGFVSSAMFGLLQQWNERGKDIDTEEFSQMMQALVLRGLSAYIPSTSKSFRKD